MKDKLKFFTVVALGVWLIITSSLALLAGWNDMTSRVTIEMAWGLIIFWIFVGGSLMYKYRDRVREFVLKIPLGWKTKFVIFATILALVEEAITTTMTNMAPFFGVQTGEAYITASTNYFDVVFLHSVIVFVPVFIGWAWALKKYDISPFATFILFGFFGILAEVSFGGPQNFLLFALWIFVYGLMIYLPAYSIPKERGTKEFSLWNYPTAFLYSILIAIPFEVSIVYVITNILQHPTIHF